MILSMTREELYKRIEERPLILDGATGSNLQKAGMPPGVCPELWILENNSGAEKLYRRLGFERTGAVNSITKGLDEIEMRYHAEEG